MKILNGGFTLTEIAVTVGLVSILILVLAEMNYINARSAQSINASDEFNNEALTLMNVIESSSSNQNSNNGCTSAFQGLNLGPLLVSGSTITVPLISQSVMPSPTPSANYNQFIKVATSPVKIYSNYLKKAGSIIQVTAPSAVIANQYFPPPKNNLWVTNLYFNKVVAIAPVTPPTAYPLLTSYMYNLHLDAQKVSSVDKQMFGGSTTYSKDFLVLLWVDNTGTVQFCGPNLPIIAADTGASCTGLPVDCTQKGQYSAGCFAPMQHYELEQGCSTTVPGGFQFAGTVPDSLNIGVCCCYSTGVSPCPQ